nr:hypothetical protein [Clostridium cadaveris]
MKKRLNINGEIVENSKSTATHRSAKAIGSQQRSKTYKRWNNHPKKI